MEWTVEALQQMIEDARADAERSHTRLRQDYDSVEGRVTALELGSPAHALALQRLEGKLNAVEDQLRSGVQVSALRFTPAMLVAIVAVCLAVVSSALWLKTGVDEIASQMHYQAHLIDGIQRMQNLNQVEIEKLLSARGTPP